MASTAASVSRSTADTECGVSLLRLYVLRATYLFLVVGLGPMIVPVLFDHEPMARGVIPSQLGGVWLLAFVGLRYPLQMLPLLLFEFAWKTTWLLAFGLPQWSSGQLPTPFVDDFGAIVAGVVLMPIVIPWGFVYRRYIKQQGESLAVIGRCPARSVRRRIGPIARSRTGCFLAIGCSRPRDITRSPATSLRPCKLRKVLHSGRACAF